MGGQDMWKRGRRICCNSLHRSSRGATLVEVTIALIVLAFMVGSVPAAVLANLHTQSRANEIRVSENLTRSAFEYVKSQDYIPGNASYPQYEIIPVDVAGFGLTVEAVPINPATGEEYHRILPGPVSIYEKDDGIQAITVKVYSFELRLGQPATGSPIHVSTNYKFEFRH
jgi:hypothetical protein